MGNLPRYDKGDWDAICDVCGGKYKASTLRQRWDGFMVCPKDWESRHPQDFVRGVADIQVPPWTRPESQDQVVAQCNLVSSSGVPSAALAGCSIPSNALPVWFTLIPPSTFTV